MSGNLSKQPELKELKKIFESKALVDFTKNGERIAYGWAWKDLEPYIEAYATQRYRDGERAGRIDERREARNLAHLHSRNECRELDEIFDKRLEAITTTTNGKEE